MILKKIVPPKNGFLADRRSTLPITKGVDQALFSVEGLFRGEIPERVFDSSRFASRITVPPGQYYLQVFYTSHNEGATVIDFFVGLDSKLAFGSELWMYTLERENQDQHRVLLTVFSPLSRETACASGSSIIPVFTPSHHQEDFIRDAQELPQCQPCQATVNRLEPGILFERDESLGNSKLCVFNGLSITADFNSDTIPFSNLS